MAVVIVDVDNNDEAIATRQEATTVVKDVELEQVKIFQDGTQDSTSGC